MTVRMNARQSEWPRAVINVIAGSLIFVASAKIRIPLGVVPVTLQTLAVQIVAWLFGPWQGAAAAALYAMEGALGWPVFSGPTAGVTYLLGPTGGYILGFIPAVTAVGVLYAMIRRRGENAFAMILAGLSGWLVLTLFGWAQLALFMGTETAWSFGVTPFLAVEVVKSSAWTFLVKERGLLRAQWAKVFR